MRGLSVAFEHHTDAHMTYVERNGVCEQEEQHHRQHERDQNGSRIAQHLHAFLAHECGESARIEAARFAHAASVFGSVSAASTSRTNASSIVGSGSSLLATRRLSASGESSAIIRARYINATRSQYSASSMKCVVTSTVTPLRTRPL